MKYVLGIIVSVLFSVSALANIPPKDLVFLSGVSSSYKSSCEVTVKGTVCHVYFSDNIQSRYSYVGLLSDLRRAESTHTYHFHLNGFGGYVNSAMAIIRAMKTTRATVITHIDGPVYSAHAYIALAGHHVSMYNLSYLMMHHSSALNSKMCAKFKKKVVLDRGQNMYKKCQDYYKAHIHIVSKLITETYSYFFTKEELSRILKGHDVYIYPSDIKKRLIDSGRYYFNVQ